MSVCRRPIQERGPLSGLAAARRLRGGSLPHVPPPASTVSSRVRLELEAPADSQPEAILTDPRRETSWRVALAARAAGRWSAEVQLPHDPTVLHYHFELTDGTVIRERRQLEGTVEPLYGVWDERDFQIAVFDPANVPPAWTRGAVAYQIFPDRFAVGDPTRVRNGGDVYGEDPLYLRWGERPERPPRGRDFFGGDLAGIIAKLDYLAELGVSCVYLTAIFAARTNHRYDAVDYMRIDPRLGDEADLRRLVVEADERGIRVVLDGVFNHCSKESEYFRRAQADRTSATYRWFDFQEWPDRYTGWVDVPYLPEFVECPEVEAFFFGEEGVARYWLDTGIAGWRLDVTPWISDGYWRRFRRAIRDGRDDLYLVAEDWGDATHRLVGDSFDATMNYRFGYSVAGYATGKLSPSELDDRLQTLRRDTPEPAFHAQLNLLDSHDTPRLLTICDGDRRRVMLAVAIQLAYPGVPMIYYGDEAGLEGDFAEDSRRTYPWGEEDEQLLAFYRTAIRARRASAALGQGDIETVWIDDATSSYGFVRRHGGEIALALFNAGEEPAEFDLTSTVAHGRWIDLLGHVEPADVGDRAVVTLPSLSACWLVDGDGWSRRSDPDGRPRSAQRRRARAR